MKTLKKNHGNFVYRDTTSIPVIAAVSCGISKDDDYKDITKSISFMKNGMFVDSNEYTPIKQESSTTLENFFGREQKT